MVEITLPICIDQGDVDVTIEISDRDYAALKRAYSLAEEEDAQLFDLTDLDDEELVARISKKVYKVLNTEPDYTEGLVDFEPGDCLEDMFDITIALPETFDEL